MESPVGTEDEMKITMEINDGDVVDYIHGVIDMEIKGNLRGWIASEVQKHLAATIASESDKVVEGRMGEVKAWVADAVDFGIQHKIAAEVNKRLSEIAKQTLAEGNHD